MLDNVELKSLFIDWISSSVKLSKGSLVNIDGKNLRGSKEPLKGKKALNVAGSVGIGTVSGVGAGAVRAKNRMRLRRYRNC